MSERKNNPNSECCACVCEDFPLGISVSLWSRVMIENRKRNILSKEKTVTNSSKKVAENKCHKLYSCSFFFIWEHKILSQNDEFMSYDGEGEKYEVFFMMCFSFCVGLHFLCFDWWWWRKCFEIVFMVSRKGGGCGGFYCTYTTTRYIAKFWVSQ